MSSTNLGSDTHLCQAASCAGRSFVCRKKTFFSCHDESKPGASKYDMTTNCILCFGCFVFYNQGVYFLSFIGIFGLLIFRLFLILIAVFLILNIYIFFLYVTLRGNTYFLPLIGYFLFLFGNIYLSLWIGYFLFLFGNIYLLPPIGCFLLSLGNICSLLPIGYFLFLFGKKYYSFR